MMEWNNGIDQDSLPKVNENDISSQNQEQICLNEGYNYHLLNMKSLKHKFREGNGRNWSLHFTTFMRI